MAPSDNHSSTAWVASEQCARARPPVRSGPITTYRRGMDGRRFGESEPFVARNPDPSADAAPGPLSQPTAPFGPLAPLLSDTRVTDVLANGSRGVWVDRGAGLHRASGVVISESDLRALAVRLVALGGRHVDEANPCVDARLGSGVRVHVILPPISPGGTLLSLRMARARPFTLAELDGAGFFVGLAREKVTSLIAERSNILVTGAAGSGKTTLLSALLGEVPHDERIVAIEDVSELRVRHPHYVALEARQPNLEGAGGVGLARLVREALRMRPDRLVLGECRGAEVQDLFSALNTGHAGGGTMHVNSLDDVPARLEALGALGGLSPSAVARQAVSALDVVLHLERTPEGRRLVAAGRLSLDPHDRLTIIPF